MRFARSNTDRSPAFFAKDAALPAELTDYFGSFDLIVSYLFDPDGIFRNNLKRCGIKMFIAGPPKLSGQRARGAASSPDRSNRSAYICKIPRRGFIRPKRIASSPGRFLADCREPVIALHPGSGSETKNWPIENWIELGEHLFSTGRTVLVVVGRSRRRASCGCWRSAWKDKPVRFAKNLPLPHLAALFENVALHRTRQRNFSPRGGGRAHDAFCSSVQPIPRFGRRRMKT